MLGKIDVVVCTSLVCRTNALEIYFKLHVNNPYITLERKRALAAYTGKDADQVSNLTQCVQPELSRICNCAIGKASKCVVVGQHITWDHGRGLYFRFYVLETADSSNDFQRCVYCQQEADHQKLYSWCVLGLDTSAVMHTCLVSLLPSCHVQVAQAFTNYRSRSASLRDREQVINAHNQGKVGRVTCGVGKRWAGETA